MNVKINEFYGQSVALFFARNANLNPSLQLQFNVPAEIFETFAELIVRECTDIIDKRKDAAIDASWNVDEAMSNAVWDIEAHFYGVEE